MSRELIGLIRQMWSSNPTWGSKRIQAELAKLGIGVSDSTVRKYRPKARTSGRDQTWKSFLKNHAKELIAVDFFAVPTATFRVLYVFLVLAHERRRVLHFNVTDSPSSAWTAQQLTEAFPFCNPPRYLLRDRDSIYGAPFQRRAAALGLEQKLIAARSPWQNPYIERLIGSIRRECLDHVIVLHAHHLKRLLAEYFQYYHRHRPHRGLAQDCPQWRLVEPPEQGKIIAKLLRCLCLEACITGILAGLPESLKDQAWPASPRTDSVVKSEDCCRLLAHRPVRAQSQSCLWRVQIISNLFLSTIFWQESRNTETPAKHRVPNRTGDSHRRTKPLIYSVSEFPLTHRSGGGSTPRSAQSGPDRIP